MLSLLFTICMIWFVGKFFVFGLRASWGIMKLLCTVIFFPVILIGMVLGGLMYIAFPLLIVGVSEKKKKAIEKATSSIAKRIIYNSGNIKPGIKTKGMFWIMHLMQKNGFNPRDAEYWKAKGWTGKIRPWK